MLDSPHQIDTPDSPLLDELCDILVELRKDEPDDQRWPKKQLEQCGAFGVYKWFIPREYGGVEWSETDIARGYLRLSAACLTTTFILTQRTGACKRIATSSNSELKTKLLPRLAAGELFATVGISHLTTSRRHLAEPVLRADETPNGFVVDGFSPWVTGGPQADHVVMGAQLIDGRQILFCLPTETEGVGHPTPFSLMALTGSSTGPVSCQQIKILDEWILGGPVENVLSSVSAGAGAGSGGLQTSMLAIGLTFSALSYMKEQLQHREGLTANYTRLLSQAEALKEALLAAVAGSPLCSNDELRVDANSLVLRATQSALVAAKGAGYVSGHPVGRWCREAMFFLVWSCPQMVSQANLCELAGIQD